MFRTYANIARTPLSSLYVHECYFRRHGVKYAMIVRNKSYNQINENISSLLRSCSVVCGNQASVG